MELSEARLEDLVGVGRERNLVAHPHRTQTERTAEADRAQGVDKELIHKSVVGGTHGRMRGIVRRAIRVYAARGVWRSGCEGWRRVRLRRASPGGV